MNNQLAALTEAEKQEFDDTYSRLRRAKKGQAFRVFNAARTRLRKKGFSPEQIKNILNLVDDISYNNRDNPNFQ